MRRHSLIAILASGLLTAVGAGSAALGSAGAGSVAGLRLASLGRFDQPVFVTQPRAERRRLFVVEKTGRVRVVRGGRVLRRPFLDLSGEVSGGSEQGLLSVAFSPDYRRSRRFYVDFTDRSGDTQIQEFRRSLAHPDRAVRVSRRPVLSIDQPFSNHNGGLLAFGPDGFLYVGSGDGGSAGDPQGNGQALETLLGKILRIDPRPRGDRPYGIPATNPFARGGGRGEIYAYGLRNPWRFSFDRRTGALLIGDVGQERAEEIDYRPRGSGRGANFGWSAFEGSSPFKPGVSAPGHVPPVFTYSHASGRCSITGGYVVRDRRLGALYGRYLYGDFCDGRLHSLRPASGSGDRPLGLTVDQLSSFGEDSRGRIYVTSLNGGVYRLAPKAR